MARHFVDTSALVKLYRSEPLSAAIQAVIQPADGLVISGLTPLEFQSAFFGMVRQKLLNSSHATQRILLFKADLADYELVPVTQKIMSTAELLLDQFAVKEGLRPADAIQLGCALDAQSQAAIDTLLTTDAVLKTCAVALGFRTGP